MKIIKINRFATEVVMGSIIPSKFASGEVHLNVNSSFLCHSDKEVLLDCRLQSSDDIMAVILAKDAIDRYTSYNCKVTLFVPYIPYARQDRVCVEGESLSISVFARLINGCNFHKVIVFDPHSYISTGLIDRVEIIDNTEFVRYSLEKLSYVSDKKPFLVSPDSGANKKINKLEQELSHLVQGVVKCDKIRDLVNRDLTNIQVFASDSQIAGNDFMIVDDICDGGKTFINLGKALKEKGANKLYLAVSHGIFAFNCLSILSTIFDKIYYTDSYENQQSKAIYPCLNKYCIPIH